MISILITDDQTQAMDVCDINFDDDMMEEASYQQNTQNAEPLKSKQNIINQRNNEKQTEKVKPDK